MKNSNTNGNRDLIVAIELMNGIRDSVEYHRSRSGHQYEWNVGDNRNNTRSYTKNRIVALRKMLMNFSEEMKW